MVNFDDSYSKHRHHSGTAFEYFEYKRRGTLDRIVHYCFPSPVAVALFVVFVGGLAVLALLTMAVELPWGW